MLPIALDPTTIRVGLAGQGDGLERRRNLLTEGGVEPVAVEEGTSLDGLRLLFVAGLEDAPAASLAARARAEGILVNVEDRPELCDFHVPAILRRGELTVTVSTNGKAPGLSRLVRDKIGRIFGTEWEERLGRITKARATWREKGLDPDAVSRRIRNLVGKEGWL